MWGGCFCALFLCFCFSRVTANMAGIPLFAHAGREKKNRRPFLRNYLFENTIHHNPLEAKAVRLRLVTPAAIELPLPLEASDCPCLQSLCMVHRLVVQWKVNIKAGCAHWLCALETHDGMCASRVPRPPGRHRAAGNNHSTAAATPAAAPNASAVVPPPERAREAAESGILREVVGTALGAGDSAANELLVGTDVVGVGLGDP